MTDKPDDPAARMANALTKDLDRSGLDQDLVEEIDRRLARLDVDEIQEVMERTSQSLQHRPQQLSEIALWMEFLSVLRTKQQGDVH